MDPDAWTRARWFLCFTLGIAVLPMLATTPLAAQTAEAAPAPPTVPQTAASSPDPVADLRSQLDALKAEYERRIADLEKRLTELQTAPGQAPTPGPPTAEAAPPPEAPPSEPAIPAEPAPAPSGGETSQASNYFNPSISVIGNFLTVAGHNRTENLPVADLRESELGIQAIVDPYARADFFLSFGEEGVGVEEGFVTFTSLPAGLLAKVGRMRASFGKVNTLHLHVLPWPDEPLPVVNLLGGEEGWIGTGGSVARLFPVGDTFTEGTLQIFRGDSEGLFAAPRRSDLAYNGHYRVFKDLTDASNLDLGLSYGVGPNGTSRDGRTHLEGLDATYRWKPLQTASYRSATFRGEVYRSRRDQPGGVETALGWYLSGDYQLAKRWFLGARLEASEHADDASLRDTGAAAILTFWPSEFSQLRGELRRRHYGLTDESANELLLQLQFAIGAHGAHPF
ncbi:MAG: hypothetical protein QOF89_4634 [Acidobacteriota bacterium]|jgi:hypothetical protein|nr:hypothetical protein [Acidobacteriota bacterium]